MLFFGNPYYIKYAEKLPVEGLNTSEGTLHSVTYRREQPRKKPGNRIFSRAPPPDELPPEPLKHYLIIRVLYTQPRQTERPMLLIENHDDRVDEISALLRELELEAEAIQKGTIDNLAERGKRLCLYWEGQIGGKICAVAVGYSQPVP